MNAPEKWGKSLAFFPTVMECCQFQKVLAGFGVPCEVVTAESDKDRQLEDFIAGKVKVIANVSMLTEGFDQPDVQTIFARDASRLPTIQMCGRGLRLSAGGKSEDQRESKQQSKQFLHVDSPFFRPCYRPFTGAISETVLYRESRISMV